MLVSLYSIYLSIFYLSTYLSIYLYSIHPFIPLYIYLPIYLFIYELQQRSMLTPGSLLHYHSFQIQGKKHGARIQYQLAVYNASACLTIIFGPWFLNFLKCYQTKVPCSPFKWNFSQTRVQVKKTSFIKGLATWEMAIPMHKTKFICPVTRSSFCREKIKAHC